MTSAESRPVFRFDGFELDLRSGELRKRGTRLRLQEQPFQVLRVLLENHGEVVTREELKKKLWPAETFVDFDDGLNTAVKKVRDTLGDSAERPRYVETIPRRGYRFIATLETEPEPATARPSVPVIPPDSPQSAAPTLSSSPASIVTPLDRRQNAALTGFYAATGVVVLLGALIGFNFHGWRQHFFGDGAPPIRSIAVLPFQDMSVDSGQDYFADGTTEELITDLSQIQSLKVISRTSAMRYRNSAKSVPQIGQELGVDAIVEGSVRRSGGRVRVTAQLVRAATDDHVWAKDYDRDESDLLNLEADVAREIAQEIRVKVTPAEASRLSRTQVKNSAVEEEFWLGRRSDDAGSDGDLRIAIEHYGEAIHLQPDYAPAHAGLAKAWAELRATNHAEAEANAKKAVEEAIQYGPDLGSTHLAVATIDVESWNWQEADKEYQTALRLDPTSAESCGCYAYFLAMMKRFPESLALLDRGAQIDPLSPVIQQVYGMSLSGFGKPSEAVPHLQRALELDSGNYTAGSFLAAIWENSGKLDDAMEVLSRPQFQSSGPLARLYALLGRNTEARAILKGLAAKPYPPHMDVASIYFALGEKDRAFEWLGKGADERDPFIVRMTLNPAFESVRSDPRFQKLVARFNIPSH